MELLLVRHGEAQPIGVNGVVTDWDRDLTPHGVQRAKLAARALNRMGVRFSAMLTSPYPRAEHTARIICEGLSKKPELRCCEHLRPGCSVADAMKVLRLNHELHAVALCGHEPTLSRLANRLLGSRKRPVLIFHTGAVAYMQLDLTPQTAAATLHWFLDSHQLDMMAQSS